MRLMVLIWYPRFPLVLHQLWALDPGLEKDMLVACQPCACPSRIRYMWRRAVCLGIPDVGRHVWEQLVVCRQFEIRNVPASL